MGGATIFKLVKTKIKDDKHCRYVIVIIDMYGLQKAIATSYIVLSRIILLLVARVQRSDPDLFELIISRTLISVAVPK